MGGTKKKNVKATLQDPQTDFDIAALHMGINGILSLGSTAENDSNSFYLYFKVRNFCQPKFRDFTIFWQIRESLERKIFYLIALAKVNSGKNVQFFGRKNREKSFFFFFVKRLLIII